MTIALIASSTIPVFADTTTITNYSAQGTVGTPGTIFPSISLHAAFDSQYQAGLTWYAQWSNPAHNGYIALNPSSFTAIDLGTTDNTVIMQGTVSSVSQVVSGDVMNVAAGNTIKITLDKTGYPFTSTWRIDDLTTGASTSGTMSTLTVTYHTTTTDTTPPSTSFSQPTNGATVIGSQPVNIFASDNVAVTKVELYVDNVLASSLTAPNGGTNTYSFTWDSTKSTNGAHTLSSKAYDAAGNVGTASISVTVSNAVQNALFYAGATSSDASAVPNYGVRSTINVINQNNMPAGSDVLPWVAETLSNNIWIQAGYINQPTGTGTTDPPQGFEEIWNLNTNTILETKYFPVTLGNHIFAISLSSGTTWVVTYDGTTITTYNTGASVSSSTLPVEAKVEIQATSLISIATVNFPTTFQVQKQPSSAWTNVATAVQGSNNFGTEGQLQNPSLPANDINIGTSIAITHGAILWNSGDTTVPKVVINTPINGARLTGIVALSGTASDNLAVANVQYSLDNGAYITASGTTSWSTSLGSLAQGTHTVLVKSVDSSGLASVITGVSFTYDSVAPAAPVITSPTNGKTTGINAYDDFQSGTYTLLDGQTSPNGKWLDRYNSFGSSGVQADSANPSNYVYFEYPQASTVSTETHSDLTISKQTFHNYKLSLDMRTNQQLRTGSAPNNWENAWVMFNFVDDWHHYYFTLKNSGWELGKKDNNLQQDVQIFLATGNSPSVTHGQFQHVDITMINNQITVAVNGVQVTSVADTAQSTAFANGGSIGLYNEDANVSFDNITVQPQ